MQFHHLKRNRTNKEARQIGRGGTRGKTSGRGMKGQNARAGRKKRPEMRDVIKRLPKLRGRGKNSLKSRLSEFLPIKLSILDKKFSSGETISPKALLEKGIIKTRNGRLPRIKILADKSTKKSFVFENVKTSKSAKKVNE